MAVTAICPRARPANSAVRLAPRQMRIDEIRTLTAALSTLPSAPHFVRNRPKNSMLMIWKSPIEIR
jgi:hypothetical protein